MCTVYKLIILLGFGFFTCHAFWSGRETRAINDEEKQGEEDWKFLVYISFQQPNPLWRICSGSIIHEQWIITAAHCVEDIYKFPKLITVGVDVHSFELEETGRDRELDECLRKAIRHNFPQLTFRRRQVLKYGKGKHNCTVSQIVVHPKFLLPYMRKPPFNVSLEYDIALLQLSKPLEEEFKPVILPDIDEDISSERNVKCISAGWGKQSVTENPKKIEKNTYTVSRKLKSFDIKLISKRKCLKYQKMPKFPSIFLGMKKDLLRIFCGNPSLSENKRSCFGDSGSPVVCERKGMQILEGIVIAGEQICSPKNNLLYITEISKFKEWIEETLREKNANTQL